MSDHKFYWLISAPKPNKVGEKEGEKERKG
jgi:hypothetical protein